MSPSSFSLEAATLLVLGYNEQCKGVGPQAALAAHMLYEHQVVLVQALE